MIQTIQTIFIVLKLIDLIDWSWFLVLSPTIAVVAIVILYMPLVMFGRLFK